jgi:acyl carrier protein
MVPSALMVLDKLPLTANGKIDRQALPEPEDIHTQSKAYIAPTTPTEEVIANIWAEVLRRDRISRDDNFFDLGGHSLLATQVISRVRRTLATEIPLRVLFEFPTVNALATQVERMQREASTFAPPPIKPVPRTQDLPLSFAQQRLWLVDQLEPNNPVYNIPRALRMKGALNRDALTRALNEIVRRHESQRTTFSVANGKPVQVIAPSLTLPVRAIDLENLAHEQREPEARRIAIEDAAMPFQLSTGPLVRATLLRLSDEDHVLTLTMHHIISDAWSAGIFMQELSALYSAYINAQSSPLPELPIQYGDYAVWQRNWLQGNVLEQQLAFWRDQLRGAPAVLSLPTDKPRPKVRTFEGAYDSFSLPEDLSCELRGLARRESATVFMTLLAAFQILLGRYSGQEQVVVGTDLANRTMVETEKLIGFFINLLPLRADLSGNPTFKQLLAQVRTTALNAYSHQDMSFDKLVEELQPERSTSHNPIVQVLFVMQNLPKRSRQLPGLELSAFEIPITRSKFDCAVFMTETEKGFTGNWLYSTELFDRSTIQRMAIHFETLLRSIVAAPDARISALEMLTDKERQQEGSEKQVRKQSQLKKLITAEAKPVDLARAQRSGKES